MYSMNQGMYESYLIPNSGTFPSKESIPKDFLDWLTNSIAQRKYRFKMKMNKNRTKLFETLPKGPQSKTRSDRKLGRRPFTH